MAILKYFYIFCVCVFGLYYLRLESVVNNHWLIFIFNPII